MSKFFKSTLQILFFLNALLFLVRFVIDAYDGLAFEAAKDIILSVGLFHFAYVMEMERDNG